MMAMDKEAPESSIQGSRNCCHSQNMLPVSFMGIDHKGDKSKRRQPERWATWHDKKRDNQNGEMIKRWQHERQHDKSVTTRKATW